MMDFPSWLPEDPAKNAAMRQGLLQFGAAMLGGRGNFGQILGQGLQTGAAGYQGSLAQQQQQQLRDAQMKQIQLETTATQDKLDKPKRIQSILSDAGGAALAPVSSLPRLGQSTPTTSTDMIALDAAPQASPGPNLGRPLSSLPQMSEPGQVAQPEAPTPAVQPVTQASQADLFQKYMGFGDKLSLAGYGTDAKEYYEMAQKLRPKVKDVKAMTVGGKRVMVQTFEDGRPPQVLDGYAPDLEKLNFQNTGGSTVALDPFTGLPVNTIRNTQSPDSVASVAQQERNSLRVDSRAREATEAGRNQVVQSDDGPLLVNTKTGGGKVIIGPDGQRLAGVTKPLTEGQSKALLFGTRMQESHKIMAQLASEGTNASVLGSRAPLIGGLINAASSDGHQMLDQAKRDFLTATLRRESGAAISPGEFETGDKQYFPQIGDSAKVIEQKARNRELAIKGVLAEVPEKQRASITPVKDLPKKDTAAQPYSDAEKERRYQAWKRSQNK
jgi:hypothetical protein